MATFPIVQFGTSRFLQAHVDLFVSEALSRGEAFGRIAVVQTTQSAESARRVAFFATGSPYRVEIKGLDRNAVVDSEVEVRSIGGGYDANREWSEVERLFCEARCMISNTGDRGYASDPGETLSADVPRSFPVKLAKLLLARFRAGAPPITLFPCELVPSNGKVLRAATLEALDRSGVDATARRYVANECVWANSLVDRIVSKPLEPAGAVAELYALWAIQNQPGLAAPCRHADVVLTDDLTPYERLKLFILNLGHTWLAEQWHAGSLDPSLLVRQAIEHAILRPSLDSVYNEEVLPVFAALGLGDEAHAYRVSVIERFSNPFLDHLLADIFNNHEAKKRIRFGGLIALAEEHGLGPSLKRLRAALGSNVDIPDRAPRPNRSCLRPCNP